MSTPQKKRVSPQTVSVRLAGPEDSSEISSVIREAFGAIRERYSEDGFADVTPDEERVRGRFAEGAMWVAEADGRVVGTVSLRPEAEGLYVRSMAVLPEFQGCGVSHTMLDALHEYAAGTGVRRIFLYTLPAELGACALYEKHGYKWVRDTPAEEWFDVPGIEMEKLLHE